MKQITVKTSYLFDTEIDTEIIVITVPENITLDDVVESIKNNHDKLSHDETGEDLYGDYGRCISTLMDYICQEERPDWSWSYLNIDTEIDLY